MAEGSWGRTPTSGVVRVKQALERHADSTSELCHELTFQPDDADFATTREKPGIL
jgi:hypothetical protein